MPIPILCYIRELNYIFEAGIYFGSKKPTDSNALLEEFIPELQKLFRDGLDVNENHFSFSFDGIICDAPAKSFVSQTKGHMGYFSCSKCLTEGSYYKDRVVFPQLDASKRTDLNFREKVNEEHHTGTSILEGLSINMVKAFRMDYMHIVCLCVVKKLIRLWMQGEVFRFRLSGYQISLISNRLDIIRNQMPLEFERKPRTLLYVEKWKATEYRQFLVYTGPVVLCGILPETHYNLFMALNVAISILLHPELCIRLNSYAKELLLYFVQQFEAQYGKEHVSHNVHALIHLADEVALFGPLDNFSAFRFENHLGTIKKRLSKSHQQLEQIHRRISEARHMKVPGCKIHVQESIVYAQEHSEGPLLDNCTLPQYKVAKFNDFTIKLSPGNNICLLRDKTIIKVENICQQFGYKVIVGRELPVTRPFYSSPCDSSFLNIFEVQDRDCTLQVWKIDEIMKKCMCLPFRSNRYIVIPLLHCTSSLTLQ